MAVASSPNSKPNTETKRKKMISISGDAEETKSEMKPANSSSQSQKRNNNPGVRVLQNGTTCHQCRHKIYGVYANCKNQAKTKPCIIKYCRTCLLNRYGEKVEDVVVLDKWDCPKCKGVCNCSICMKKRGHQPTGMVAKMAKAGRFSSVLDMILAKGAQNVSKYKRVKETSASPRKLGAPAEGIKISSPKEKPNNMKRKGFEVNLDGSGVNDVSVTETNHALNGHNQKKLKSKGSKETVEGDLINGLISKVNGGQQPKNEVKEHIIHDQNATQHLEDNEFLKVKKNALNLLESVIPLPTGIELVTIAGVDLPKEDAGNALQLLEFSSTFGNILDVKKGQAEAVLRDLIKGRSTRRGKFTSVIQFQIQLLSVIQEELESELELESESESESKSESPASDLTHANDSWLKALKSCISKSKLKHMMDFIDMTVGGKVRNWIDDQIAKLSEKRKEAKDKLSVAKDKEKSLKQKMQDDIAKAIIAKEGVSLTIKEHDAIVSKIKDKAAEAHAEMLACKNMVPIDIERPDAVRTESIFSDNNGHVYWRLKGCSEKPGILQDIGTGDHTVESVDKWFEYDDEQMDLIEKHINVLRSQYRKYYKNGK